MIPMGAGSNHWPQVILEVDMHQAKEQGYSMTPFQTTSDLGFGVRLACPCGCLSMGSYHLVQRRKMNIFLEDDLVKWDPKVKQTVEAKTEIIQRWELVNVETTYKPAAESHSELARRMAEMIPGIRDIVPSPCTCIPKQMRTVWSAIQHLNDQHHPRFTQHEEDGWSRERIAEWLETLDADLTLDPDHKASPVKMKAMEIQTYTDEFQASLAKAMNATLLFQGELFAATSAIEKLKDTLKSFKQKPPITNKQKRLINKAYVSGGVESVSALLEDMGISTMELSEALMQVPEMGSHNECNCIPCKYKKQHNQEES